MIEVSRTSAPAKTYSGFIVSLLLVIVLGIFLVWPKYQNFQQVSAERKASLEAEARVEAQQKSVNALFDKLSTDQANFDRVALAIPDKSELTQFYAWLELLGRSNNLAITSLQGKDEADLDEGALENVIGIEGQPLVNAPSPSLAVVSVNMQVAGALNDFKNFLLGLQNSLRIIDVQGIDVEYDKEKNSLTYRLALKTYYKK